MKPPASLSSRRRAARPLAQAAALACALAAALAAVPAQAADAAPARPAAPRSFDIPAGPLAEAVARYAGAAGVALSFDAQQLRGLRSPGLHGSFTVDEGFAKLLGEAGLQAVRQPAGDYVLRPLPKPAAAAPAAAAPASASPTPYQLAPVTVTANAQARSVTEGSGAYAGGAVAIGLGEHSQRETPSSVSVVTRQRIEDQNFITLEDAMQYTTAMKVTTYGTNTSAIEARGYTIDHYQIDGVSSSARVYENNFGLAMFDHVEVWRGPAGLLQGSGDPGGTVNFVRKRAQDRFGFGARVAVGSWGNRYAEADVTGPLAAEGRLRGRLVAAYQDRGYFTDFAHTREPLVYGTLEYDLAPETTLSLGTSWQRNHSRPFFGLSAYENGTYPAVPRSTYLGADWNDESQEASRSFAELEHRLEGGGTLRLSAVAVRRRDHGQIAWGNSFIDPDSGDVEMIPYFSRQNEDEVDLDGQFTLPLQWQGRKQELVLGASHQKLRSAFAYNGSTWGDNGFPLNVFHPDIHVPRPDVTIDPATHSAQTQSALYGQARIRPLDALTLLAGARVAWFKSEDREAPENDQSVAARWVPYAGFVFDVSRAWSVYGSYSSIFSPQTDRSFDGRYLPPRKGGQVEGGVKGEHFGGALTSSLELYRIEDTNRSMVDPDHPDFSIAAGEVRSQGAEAELSGRLGASWNLSAGYGYNTTRLVKASPDQQGRPFTTTFPRHTLSLWSDYRFADGPAQGLSLGFGVKLRSAIYNEDSGVRWGQGGYSVYALQAGYQITPQWHASLTVNNLFDKKYLDRPETGYRQTYFGEPRNAMLSLAYKMQ